VPQPKIAKINKNSYFGSSGFFKVIDVDTNKKPVTSAFCDGQHSHAYLQPFFMKDWPTAVKNDLRGYCFLMPSCSGFLEPRKSKLGLLKSMFNTENFLHSFSLSLFIDFSAIRSLNVSRNYNCPKIHKKLYFGVQSHPRSLLLVPIKSPCTTSYW